MSLVPVIDASLGPDVYAGQPTSSGIVVGGVNADFGIYDAVPDVSGLGLLRPLTASGSMHSVASLAVTDEFRIDASTSSAEDIGGGAGTLDGCRLRQQGSLQTMVPSRSYRSSAPAAARPLLDAFPLPAGASSGDFGEYRAQWSRPASLYGISVRLDHTTFSDITTFLRHSHSPFVRKEIGTPVAGSLPTLVHSSFAAKQVTAGAVIPASNRDWIALATHLSVLDNGLWFALGRCTQRRIEQWNARASVAYVRENISSASQANPGI